MTILVTGGCGYIGSRLLRDLAADVKLSGSTIRILDSMLKERYVSLMDLPPTGQFEFIEGDIRKDDDLRKAFQDVEMVVDLAGITNAPLSFDRKDLTFDVNVNGGRKMVEHALKEGVERFVYSSTASVYGPTRGMVDETFPCRPISPYGESKLQAEKFCMEAAEENGLNATVLRFGTVYGYSIGIRFDTVVDRFAYLACAGTSLPIWESARMEKRPYLHVADASEAITFALEHADMKGEIYNVVGENASIDRITGVIEREVPDVRVVISPSPSLNQVSYEIDESKIERAGFRPCRTLEEGVKEIVDHFSGLVRSRSRKSREMAHAQAMAGVSET
jgi:UDP-glucose 4-epimerase